MTSAAQATAESREVGRRLEDRHAKMLRVSPPRRPSYRWDWQSMLCECPEGSFNCIEGSAVITQLNEADGSWRSQPLYPQQYGLSVVPARLTMAEAFTARVGRVPLDSDWANRRVRVSYAEILREAGFGVAHTPSKRMPVPHATVVWDLEDPTDRQTAPWPPEVVSAYEACFTIPPDEEGTDGQS